MMLALEDTLQIQDDIGYLLDYKIDKYELRDVQFSKPVGDSDNLCKSRLATLCYDLQYSDFYF